MPILVAAAVPTASAAAPPGFVGLTSDFENMWGLHTGLLTTGNGRKPAYTASTRAVGRLR